jgi:hypothetical protein
LELPHPLAVPDAVFLLRLDAQDLSGIAELPASQVLTFAGFDDFGCGKASGTGVDE